MHQCIKLFYFGMTLYMFWTVFPSIISSSRLYIQQQAHVKQTLMCACQWVRDGTELENVHTATGKCQTDTAVCLLVITRWNTFQDCTYSNRHMSNRYCCVLASGYEMERSSLLYIQQQAYVKQTLLSACTTDYNNKQIFILPNND